MEEGAPHASPGVPPDVARYASELGRFTAHRRLLLARWRSLTASPPPAPTPPDAPAPPRPSYLPLADRALPPPPAVRQLLVGACLALGFPRDKAGLALGWAVAAGGPGGESATAALHGGVTPAAAAGAEWAVLRCTVGSDAFAARLGGARPDGYGPARGDGDDATAAAGAYHPRTDTLVALLRRGGGASAEGGGAAGGGDDGGGGGDEEEEEADGAEGGERSTPEGGDDKEAAAIDVVCVALRPMARMLLACVRGEPALRSMRGT